MANGKPGAPKGHPKYGGGSRKGKPNRVTSLAAQKLRDTEMTADATVEAIRRGAFADIGDCFDKAGNLKSLHEMTEAQRWMIAGIEVVMKNAAAGDNQVDRVLKIKWADRSKYVDLAAKYHKLLVEVLDVNVTEVGSRLDAARLAAAQRNRKAGKGDGRDGE